MIVRRATELKGLKETRTMQGSKKRSMPRVQSSAYLDIFILEKEKDRLEKEMFVLEKRRDSLRQRLEEIAAETEKLKGSKSRGTRTPSSESKIPQKKDWKKMSMTY